MKRAPKSQTHSGVRLFGEPERPAAVHVAYVDGASRGNPGPASYAVILRGPDGATQFEIGKYLGRATNNVAEYYALITALDYAQSQNIAAAAGAQRFGAAGAADAGPLQGEESGPEAAARARAEDRARLRLLRHRARAARAEQRRRRARQLRARSDRPRANGSSVTNSSRRGGARQIALPRALFRGRAASSRSSGPRRRRDRRNLDQKQTAPENYFGGSFGNCPGFLRNFSGDYWTAGGCFRT